jgi:hypothetical protein
MSAYANQVVWDETIQEKPAVMAIPVLLTITTVNASAILAAAMALSLGTAGKSSLVVDTTLAVGSNVRPVGTEIQKESRFRVGFTDNVTGKPYSFTIPCADLSLMDPGTEEVPLTGTEAAALVTALQTNGRSELNNLITVNSIKYVTL